MEEETKAPEEPKVGQPAQASPAPEGKPKGMATIVEDVPMIEHFPEHKEEA